MITIFDRIRQHYTQDTTRQRFYHHQLFPGYSHYNDAFQNNRGAFSHLHNISRCQNRNCTAQKVRADACENEEDFCSVRTNCLSAHRRKRNYHLFWRLEFFGGSICVVYNLYNDWLWRLCAFGITAEKNRSWRGLAESPHRLLCSFIASIPVWFEPDVVHLELPRWLCGWNTKFPGKHFKVLPKFAFTYAKAALAQNRGVSRQWLITRNKLKHCLIANWNWVILGATDERDCSSL